MPERLGENNPRWRHGYADPDESSLHWLIVCKPDCQLNAVRLASFQLEEEAAASGAWNYQAVYVAQDHPRDPTHRRPPQPRPQDDDVSAQDTGRKAQPSVDGVCGFRQTMEVKYEERSRVGAAQMSEGTIGPRIIV